MKIIQYDFYFGSLLALKEKPEKDPFKDSINVMTMYLSIFLIGIIFRVAMEFDIWQWLMENWPYEYGRVHSKNFAAPTGIIAIVSFFFFHFSLKKYFLRQKLIERLQSEFEIDDPELKVHSFIPRTLLFLFIFYSVMIAGAYWGIVIFCTFVILTLELWVRYRFFWNREALLQKPYAVKLFKQREKEARRNRTKN